MEAVLNRAGTLLDTGEPLRAIHLAEIVHRTDTDNKEAKRVLRAAHELLLQGSNNFWESAWLREQIKELS